MKPVQALCHAVYVALAVFLFGTNNVLTAIALGIGIVAFLVKDRRPIIIVVFLLAGFIGFIMEYLCTAVWHAWTYSYPSTIVLPFNSVYKTLPGWLFLFWGYFTVIIINLAAIIEEWLYTSVFWRNRALKRTIAILAWLIIIELAILANTVIGPGRYAYYLVLCLVMLYFWHTPNDLITFYIAGVYATFGEWVCIQRGLWAYTSLYIPEFSVPVTLPLAWGFSVLFISRLGSYIIGKKEWVQKS
jgi:hypothetical protein